MTNSQILLVSAGFLHPPAAARRILKKIISQHMGVIPDQVKNLEQVADRNLNQYKALVLYCHHKNSALSPRELDAFNSFVSAGGGVLAIHSATASYKGTKEYFDIIGGRFISHGPLAAYTIEPVRIPGEGTSGPPTAGNSVLFAGIGPFPVDDEIYIHELSGDITVHMTTDFEGNPVPMVWTRSHDRGRICYLGPGHRTATLRLPEIQSIITMGLDWVTGI